jgi:hypothetical protein
MRASSKFSIEYTLLSRRGEDLKITNEIPPVHWKHSCVYSECSLHQISPFIGKLKSSIARDLVLTYSKPGDLIADPFAGSGTIPLEAQIAGRRVFSADINPYAKVLCSAKLKAPTSCSDALIRAEKALTSAEAIPDPDLRRIQPWVRKFFHPKTLKQAIKFAGVCRARGDDFLLACFLGILHHQRPGFLSFPSSHLVPYLRTTRFPRKTYPEMYEFRDLRPRLLAKIHRVFTRPPIVHANEEACFRRSSIQRLAFPKEVDCVITSPPYMNALDYNRDNRLRLWFISPGFVKEDEEVTSSRKAFVHTMIAFANKVDRSLRSKSFCIVIVGERVARTPGVPVSEFVRKLMAIHASNLRLLSILEDEIPDVRRSRKTCTGTKKEHFLVFRKK